MGHLFIVAITFLYILSPAATLDIQKPWKHGNSIPNISPTQSSTKSVLLMGGLIPNSLPMYQHTRTTEYWPEVGESCVNKGTLLPYAVGDSAAGVFDEYIFYCGCYGTKYDNNCTKSPVAGGEWIAGPNMIKSRALFSIVSMDSSLVAIGGDGREGIQNTIEIFEGESWKLAEYKLSEPRYGHCSVKISSEEILVIGNWKGTSMDLINIADGTVSFFGNTTTQKYFFGCTFDDIENIVYVSGGGNGRDGNNNIFEMFDLHTRTWTRMPDLRTPRVYHGMEIIDGKLTVIGGYFNGNSLSVVEQYDPDNFEWKLVGEISVGRDEFAMVPLRC